MKTTTSKNKFTVYSLQFALFVYCLLPIGTFAQVGQWTWLHGPKTLGTLANYGTQQVAAPSNNPSGLYEPCQWTDTAGNFWMFGGIDFNYNKNGDLWEYDKATNQWTWMNGTGTVDDPGYYGVQGVPSLGNVPPARSHGMATWTDKNNNLWFFGGSQNLSLSFNDLWKYDIANNEWTWMKGPDTVSNPGVYGTQGVPDIANLPPHRHETVATWVDSSGDLWLFGGFSYPAQVVYNDLWRFNIATNTWTWMKGANTPNDPGNYGTQKIESATTLPPARSTYAHLKDKHENLWIFGGFDQTFSTLNDIWRYNPVTNNWVWLSGSQNPGASGVYGTKCVTDSSNIPGSRMENRACWTDNKGNLWFFGGFIQDGTPVSNELWKFCIESDEWTLVNGDTIPNPTGNWGTIGIPSPTNKPDGRGGSVSWIDSSRGDLYMFGGAVDANTLISHGDLWKFRIDTACGPCADVVLPVAHFTANDSNICANGCINFTDLSSNSTSWIWSFPGAMPSTSTDENPQNICYLTPGVYNVSLIATSYKGSSTISFSNYIHVAAAPVTPTISIVHGDTLYCSTDPSYVTYQWYIDSVLIPGATDSMLVITHSGNYNIKITNTNGCGIAVGINVVGIKEYSLSDFQFTVSPNPTGDLLTLTGNTKMEIGKLKLGIYNVLGQQIYGEQLQTSNFKPQTINVSSLAGGVYFLQVSNESGKWIGRFVKQ